MLIDTHAHLYWESFQEDFGQVLKRALESGVTHIINIGVDVETSLKAVGLNSDKIQFYSSVGIHPHEAIKYSDDVSIQKDIDELEKIYGSNASKVTAVGECGLDFLFESTPPTQAKTLQKKLFQAQIDLAKKLNLPLLIHCRDDRSQNPNNSEAWDETLSMIGPHPTVLHCYSGLPSTTTLALQSPNILFSFAGNITYPKNDYLLTAIKIIPLERLLVETDCPFLSPQSNRGQRNEPAYILETYKLISQIKNAPLDQVCLAIAQNASHIGLIKT